MVRCRRRSTAARGASASGAGAPSPPAGAAGVEEDQRAGRARGIVQGLPGVAADALTTDEGKRAGVDDFAKLPDRLEISVAERRSRREQTCGDRPTIEVVRRPEPFDAVAPPSRAGAHPG